MGGAEVQTSCWKVFSVKHDFSSAVHYGCNERVCVVTASDTEFGEEQDVPHADFEVVAAYSAGRRSNPVFGVPSTLNQAHEQED